MTTELSFEVQSEEVGFDQLDSSEKSVILEALRGPGPRGVATFTVGLTDPRPSDVQPGDVIVRKVQ